MSMLYSQKQMAPALVNLSLIIVSRRLHGVPFLMSLRTGLYHLPNFVMERTSHSLLVDDVAVG